MIPWEETDALRRVLVEWALRVDIPVDVLGEDVTTDDAHRARLLLILLAARCDSLEQRGRYDEAGWAAALGLTPSQIDHLMDILASLDLVSARGERADDPEQAWYWIEAPEPVVGEVLRSRASGPASAAMATDARDRSRGGHAAIN
jgi:hypothetical protein